MVWIGQAEGTILSAETTKDAGSRASRSPKTKPVYKKQVPSLPSLAKPPSLREARTPGRVKGCGENG